MDTCSEHALKLHKMCSIPKFPEMASIKIQFATTAKWWSLLCILISFWLSSSSPPLSPSISCALFRWVKNIVWNCHVWSVRHTHTHTPARYWSFEALTLKPLAWFYSTASLSPNANFNKSKRQLKRIYESQSKIKQSVASACIFSISSRSAVALPATLNFDVLDFSQFQYANLPHSSRAQTITF